MFFILKLVRKILFWFFAITLIAVIIPKFVPVYYTPLMISDIASQISEGKIPRIHHQWVPLSEMSPSLIKAVMAGEDQRYTMHHGFDTQAIKRAWDYNKHHSHKLGASTITQQTVKNVFLWQQRSWLRKGLETYFTFLVEFIWGKRRTMEIYLNSIEMGKNIYGAQAVARQHFNKTADQLTPDECALIAASLPNPKVMNSQSPSPYLKRRQMVIRRQMRKMPDPQLK